MDAQNSHITLLEKLERERKLLKEYMSEALASELLEKLATLRRDIR